MPAVATKTERLEARVSPELKALIQRAAELRGLSVTDFLSVSAQAAAIEALRERQIILSARDSALFAQAILEPTAPGDRLRAAAQKYQALVGR